MRRILVPFVFAGFLAAGCGSGLPENTASGPPPRPVQPGASITNTRMCACTACGEASCCRGASEPESSSKKCESYDFSSEGCGLEVASCASRCYQSVWRVRLDQDCEEKRPHECC